MRVKKEAGIMIVASITISYWMLHVYWRSLESFDHFYCCVAHTYIGEKTVLRVVDTDVT